MAACGCHLFCRGFLRIRSLNVLPVISRGAFFKAKEYHGKEVPEKGLQEKDPLEASVRDGHSTKAQLNLLAAKKSLTTKQPYKPAPDVEDVVQRITLSYCDAGSKWREVSLHDPKLKYKLLRKMISDLNHDIPSSTMDKMCTVDDALEFFQTEVHEASALEDLSKLDLPKNLHIQTEYLRFDPETDKMFGGRTAFPGSDTVVTSIKYKRKYKDVKTSVPKPGYANHYYGY